MSSLFSSSFLVLFNFYSFNHKIQSTCFNFIILGSRLGSPQSSSKTKISFHLLLPSPCPLPPLSLSFPSPLTLLPSLSLFLLPLPSLSPLHSSPRLLVSLIAATHHPPQSPSTTSQTSTNNSTNNPTRSTSNKNKTCTIQIWK